MSQGASKTDGEEILSPGRMRSSQNLARMISEGRSFSGRERNCCFLNTGMTSESAARFARISAVSGLDHDDDGRAVAVVDWDHDGDMDIWITNRNAPRIRLMRNDLVTSNDYLMLKLVGNGKSTNRDAVGACVELIFKDSDPELKSCKSLRAGEGFLSQNTKWLHFGLGKNQQIEKAIVRWPGGATEEIKNLEPNRRYEIVQGSGTGRDVSQSRQTTIQPSAPELPPATQVASIRLTELIKFPESIYRTVNSGQRILKNKKDRKLLVVLWSKSCGFCGDELKELTNRHDEIKAMGIDIVALCVDMLTSEVSPVEIKQYVREQFFPFESGLATWQLIATLQNFHNRHISLHKQLPMPCSFLLNEQGRLTTIYKGPVNFVDLQADAQASVNIKRSERRLQTSQLNGSLVAHPRVEQISLDHAVSMRFLLAYDLQKANQFEMAAEQYADGLRLKPGYAKGHNNLGLVLQRLRRYDKAVRHFEQALEIEPESLAAHINLGNTRLAQKKYDLAAGHYLDGLKIDNQSFEAHHNLGLAYAAQQIEQNASDHFSRAVEINPNFVQGHLSLAIHLQKNGKVENAINHCLQALQSNPQSDTLHKVLGDFYLESGERNQAIQHYRKAVQIQPANNAAKKALQEIF